MHKYRGKKKGVVELREFIIQEIKKEEDTHYEDFSEEVARAFFKDYRYEFIVLEMLNNLKKRGEIYLQDKVFCYGFPPFDRTKMITIYGTDL